MKDKTSLMLNMLSPLLLVVGDLSLLFSQAMFVGYVLFSIGCILGVLNVARVQKFEVSEKFHLLTTLIGLAMLGVFIFTSVIERLVIVALILFVIDFLILAIDTKMEHATLRKEKSSLMKKKNSQYDEQKAYEELEHIQEQFNNIQILEDGDREDLSLRAQAEKIKKEFANVIVDEDPKEGRYFYKEDGKLFHAVGCMALQRTDKDDLKSTNSRTELLAKGYKSCKVCNS